MPAGKLVFAQIFESIHPEQFRRYVNRYGGNHKTSSFSCWEQFLAMAFAQITFRDSLADLEVCLRSRPDQLYHLGFRSTVPHSTLADANRTRDWRIYSDLAQSLIKRARRLYADEPLGLDIKEAVHALDSTTIDLCLSLFPWARFRSTKSAIKLNTLLDLRGPIPTVVTVSEGKQADVRALDDLLLETGAYYIFDRGYLDFRRLFQFVRGGACFVPRTKAGVLFNRVASRPVDRTTGVRSDHVVVLRMKISARHYPERLRRVACRNPESGKVLVFLTNNFSLPPEAIAHLYKMRWRVELFFKWIKQNLRIKHFFGTSENAVKTQVWIAICVYVQVAILRHELRITMTLSQILQILSIHPFEQIVLAELLAKAASQSNVANTPNQLMLWD